MLCPGVHWWGQLAVLPISQAHDVGQCHFSLCFPFQLRASVKTVWFFRGNLPDTSAARRARWTDRCWRRAVCAGASRRLPGASASDPGLLSDSAARHGQRNEGETRLISLHYRGRLRWQMISCGILGWRLTRVTAPSVGSMKTAVSEWSSPSSELRLALLWLILTGLKKKTHASCRQLHVFIRADVQKINDLHMQKPFFNFCYCFLVLAASSQSIIVFYQ